MSFLSSAFADEAAQRFVASIYAQYNRSDKPGIMLDSKGAAERYFTPELVLLMEQDEEKAVKDDELPTLDGDPFVGAQDWDIKDIAISVKDVGTDKTKALVSFRNMGEQKIVELDLKKITAGWRIDGILWADDTLRGLYKENKDRPTLGTQKV